MSLSDKMVSFTSRSMGKSTHLHFIAGNKTIFLTVDDVQEAVKALKDACIDRFEKNDKPEDDLNFVMNKIKEIFGEKLL